MALFLLPGGRPRRLGAVTSAIHDGGAVYYDVVHAWDYLEYAYLQKAQDREARAIRDSVRLDGTLSPT